MAENEILYVAGGRFWKRTRNAFVNGCSIEDIAARVPEDLDCAVRNSLAREWKKNRNTLHSLYSAASVSEEAVRTTRELFNDRQFARLVTTEFEICGLGDKTKIADGIANRTADRAVENVMRHACNYDALQDHASRSDLCKAISACVDRYRPTLRLIAEASLVGLRIPPPPRMKPRRASKQLKAKEVASKSLLPMVAAGEAKRPN